jgi:hypothetical protein
METLKNVSDGNNCTSLVRRPTKELLDAPFEFAC